MRSDTTTSTASAELGSPEARRLFLREPGWTIAQKVGSDKQFCFVQKPGQDYYHRLLDGELYLFSGDERLCIACATRRGLLSYEAKALRERGVTVEIEEPEDSEPFDVPGVEDEE
jgi:hypothetical protein